MTALPKSIKRQLEEANALQASLAAPAEPEQPAEEPEVEAPAVLEVKPKADEDDAAKWQQRYRTLQGEFNAKVPKLQSELKERTAELDNLKQRIAALESQKPAERLTTSKDEEEFGADMLDLIDRKARESFQPREAELLSVISELKGELQQIKGQMNTVAESHNSNATEVMLSKLTEQVPNWRAINEDQGFLDWLGEEDPTSGIIRQRLLEDAAASHNANRLAAIFKAYVGVTPQQPKSDSLQSHAAPAREATSSPKVDSQKARIYTTKEIEKFYEDAYRRNIYSMEKRAELEREINLAISENRVR